MRTTCGTRSVRLSAQQDGTELAEVVLVAPSPEFERRTIDGLIAMSNPRPFNASAWKPSAEIAFAPDPIGFDHYASAGPGDP